MLLAESDTPDVISSLLPELVANTDAAAYATRRKRVESVAARNATWKSKEKRHVRENQNQ
jgi:hypothetical protein